MNGESSIDVRRLIDVTVTGTNTASAGEPSCTVFTGTALPPPPNINSSLSVEGKRQKKLIEYSFGENKLQYTNNRLQLLIFSEFIIIHNFLLGLMNVMSHQSVLPVPT